MRFKLASWRVKPSAHVSPHRINAPVKLFGEPGGGSPPIARVTAFTG